VHGGEGEGGGAAARVPDEMERCTTGAAFLTHAERDALAGLGVRQSTLVR
jgi:hypothetical protein